MMMWVNLADGLAVIYARAPSKRLTWSKKG